MFRRSYKYSSIDEALTLFRSLAIAVAIPSLRPIASIIFGVASVVSSDGH